ncbi:MAG: tetratricopeptide repeat protein [Oscillatoriales cyanobacterium SM2_2_1]|nr:tetratricopeptide repeat protein [Oscillatoriales cyanobacterium SM2_2_1]
MTQRNARQWMINIVLVIVSVAFMGVSLAPMLGGLFASSPTPTADPNTISEQDQIKIQIQGFEAVLRQEPKNQTALEGIVGLKLQIGDVRGTIEPLQTLSESYPDQARYRIALARTYVQLKEFKNATDEYRKLLATNPGDPEALQSLVGFELQEKRPEAAIGILQEALKNAATANQVKPGSVNVAYIQWLLGEVYRDQKRYAEALASFEEALKTDDKDFRGHLGKAQVLRSQGKKEEAQSLFAKAIELAPPDVKDRVKELATTPEATPTPTPTQP